MMSQNLRTPADARMWLDRHGVTVTQWARANGFEPTVVLALLSGRTRGRWGMAYSAAVALGMKSAPTTGELHPLADQGVAGMSQPPREASQSNAHFMEVSP